MFTMLNYTVMSILLYTALATSQNSLLKLNSSRWNYQVEMRERLSGSCNVSPVPSVDVLWSCRQILPAGKVTPRELRPVAVTALLGRGLSQSPLAFLLTDGTQVTPGARRVLLNFPAMPLCSINTESGRAVTKGPCHTT